jgi:hypothetical protein
MTRARQVGKFRGAERIASPTPSWPGQRRHGWPTPSWLANPVMAGLDPAILTRTDFANDPVPVSNHPMGIARS